MWAVVRKVASADSLSIFYRACAKFVARYSQTKLIVRFVVKWREFRGNKKIARQLWSATQDSRNAVNRSRTGKTVFFFNLFAQISGRIWTVVNRGFFSNASPHSENVATARRVKLRLLLVNKNKRKNLRVLFNLYSVPRDNNWAERETKNYF